MSHKLLVLHGWPRGLVESGLVPPSPSWLHLLGSTKRRGVTSPPPAPPQQLPCPWQTFRDSSGLKTLCPFPSRGIWSWGEGSLVPSSPITPRN